MSLLTKRLAPRRLARAILGLAFKPANRLPVANQKARAEMVPAEEHLERDASVNTRKLSLSRPRDCWL
jgi:hypothetical protein